MKKQVFIIVMMLMPLMASAQTKINGIYYFLDSTNKVASVTCDHFDDSYGPPIISYSGEIVIPNTIVFGGITYSVTTINGDAFDDCTDLTSVTIPNSVTSIGDGAFSGCSNLNSITVENGNAVYDSRNNCNAVVKTSTNELVAGCKSTIIPNSVTSIGDGAFSGCSALTSVTIPNSVTSIGDGAFSGCSGLTSIAIPNSMTSIGPYTFGGCTGLKSVHITDLAAWCKIDFSYCFDNDEGYLLFCNNPLFYAHHLFLNGEEVKDLVVPNGVTSIGDYSFIGCTGLTSVEIPNSVTSIGEGVFDFTSIEKYTFHCQEIESRFINKKSIKEVIIGDEVKSIVGGAFSDCTNLSSVTFGNSVTSIGNYAFYGCTGLNSVHITNLAAWCKINFYFYDYGYDIEGINNPLLYAHHLFLNGEEIKDLVIPYGITSIGDYSFIGCTGLTSVEIPNSVTSIGNSAFSNCSGLTSVTIPKSVTSIGSSAFSDCSSLQSVNISDIAAWCNISCYDNPLYYAHHLFLNGEEVKDLVIPDGVTSIGDYSFKGCTGLTSVEISTSVTSIGSSAFSGCSGLTSVTIPNSVTAIGTYAFSGCSSLTSVTIPNNVTSIKNYAFQGCSSLTSVTIGNGVNSIGNYAFYGCSKLFSVSIGKGTKSVGARAFANCPEIKEVYCYANDVPTISNDTFENSYYIKFATLYVPESSVDLYKASAWSQFGNIVGITGGNEGERCEKPVITLLANGKIKVESATEGATCVTNITASNAEPLSDEEISLNTPLIVYTVSSYATKEGYDDSEVATATFRYEKAEGDMNGDGMLNITDVIHLVNMILGQ